MDNINMLQINIEIKINKLNKFDTLRLQKEYILYIILIRLSPKMYSHIRHISVNLQVLSVDNKQSFSYAIFRKKKNNIMTQYRKYNKVDNR